MAQLYNSSIAKSWQAKTLVTIVSDIQLINEITYPFWGLDVGA